MHLRKSKDQAELGDKVLGKGQGTIAWNMHNERASKEQSDLGLHTIIGSKALPRLDLYPH